MISALIGLGLDLGFRVGYPLKVRPLVYGVPQVGGMALIPYHASPILNSLEGVI